MLKIRGDNYGARHSDTARTVIRRDPILLLTYGEVTNGAPMYSVSLGLNLNLLSGAAMTLFGAGLLIAAYRVS